MNLLQKYVLAIILLSSPMCLYAQIYQVNITGRFPTFPGNEVFMNHLKERFGMMPASATYDDETKTISFFFPAAATPFATIRNPRLVLLGMRATDGAPVKLMGTYQKGSGPGAVISLYWHPGLAIE